MTEKVIVTAAVNGNRKDHPGLNIPVTPEEIAEDAYRCYEAGAAVVHFHARDVETRYSTAEIAVFSEVISRIRDKCDVLIETTTGVGPKIDPKTRQPIVDPATGLTIKPSDEERLKLLDIKPAPDLGSVAAGSMNMYNPVYDDAVIFVNSPHYINESVKRLVAKPRIAFQFECFDVGFLDNVQRLVDLGLIDSGTRFWLQYTLGWGGLAATERNLALISEQGRYMFPDARWGVCSPVPQHFGMAAAGARLGADCLRTGLEDTAQLANGDSAGNNTRLVEELVGIVRAAGREIASPAEARQMLRIA